MADRGAVRSALITGAILLLFIPIVNAGAATTKRPSASRRASVASSTAEKIIVVLKDQATAIPDSRANALKRTAAIDELQSHVVRELNIVQAHQVRQFQLIDAIAATVTPDAAHKLAKDPTVAAVMPDEPIRLADTTPTVRSRDSARHETPLSAACLPTGHVQLDPEAIETIHAATQSGSGRSSQGLGYTGSGVKVGYIADGIDVNNPDLIRADGQHVIVDQQDFSGTGSESPTSGGESFLDASSIAAQGRRIYNVGRYGFQRSNQICKIRVLGVAPEASLVSLSVYGSSGVADASVYLQAIDYAVTVDRVNVLNESFAANSFPDAPTMELVDMADDAAVAAGVTVVAGAGDAGAGNTIGSPASDPTLISVGASTTYRIYAQTGYDAVDDPAVTGWLSNNISPVSSGGLDQSGSTVDLVAPGDLNWALCTPKPKRYSACVNFHGRPSSVLVEGGTSESAPLTAGVAAIVIQAYAMAHDGEDPTPAVVKQILTSTAQDISAPQEISREPASWMLTRRLGPQPHTRDQRVDRMAMRFSTAPRSSTE